MWKIDFQLHKSSVQVKLHLEMHVDVHNDYISLLKVKCICTNYSYAFKIPLVPSVLVQLFLF